MADVKASCKLWLIGGTSDSVRLATALAEIAIPCLVTVTTAEAQRAYPTSPWLEVAIGPLEPDGLPNFVRQHQIGAILDASHPFATAISQAAVATARAMDLPYWRYERPTIERDPGGAAPFIKSMATLETLLTSEIMVGQRVLLTLGYRWLPAFAPWHHRCCLFARILPSAVALETALQAGFPPERLIALRPPISLELERALWNQWAISLVVTKASGQAGGEATKRQLAQLLGIPLVVIERPPIAYPVVTTSDLEAVQFCRQWWAAIPPA